jgi:hypothetical protein
MMMSVVCAGLVLVEHGGIDLRLGAAGPGGVPIPGSLFVFRASDTATS